MLPVLQKRAAAVGILLVLAACKGAGSNGLPATNSMQPGAGSAAFKVYLPSPANAPGTAPGSMVVQLLTVDGKTMAAAPVTLNFAAQTHGCTAMPDGALSCVASVAAPRGSDTFTIATYSGPNGTGSRIASSQTTTTVKAGAAVKCVPAGVKT